MASSLPLRDRVRQLSKTALRPLHRLRGTKPKPYCYTSLDERAKQIRILTLLPGKFPSTIQVKLETVQLSAEHVFDFEALSYTWGLAEDPVEILIETKFGPQVLVVTQNLAEALQYLRYETAPRILWIDAICIDQQNIPERSSQVKRMADLYTLSKRVVVWLGPEGHDSSLALSLLESLATKIKVDWASETMKAISEDQSEQHWVDKGKLLPYNEREIAAVYAILERPWFERLWIWQEIWLAGPTAILVCGGNTILWATFRNAYFCVHSKRWRPLRRRNLPARQSSVYRLCRASNYRYLPHLLSETQYSKCTDPRDRIFALLSLLNPRDPAAAIEPDYKKNVSEVYTEVFLRYCKKAGHLRLMQRCELADETIGIPTWLPNWSVPEVQIGKLEIDQIDASGNSAPVFEVIEERRFRVCGITIGTLESVARHSIFKDSASAIYTIKDFTAEIHRIAHQFRVSDTQLEAFCDTLCAGLFDHVFYPQATANPDHPNLLQSIECLSRIIETPYFNEAYLSKSDELFINRASSMLRGRSAYNTSGGTFGIAPNSAEPGDIIVVLLGFLSAMILRPFYGNTYKVVGESYCNGYMCCESFLGSLPNTHRMVWLTEKRRAHVYPVYLELDSSTTQVEDPRSGELPKGWKLRDHNEKHMFHHFMNEETGERTVKDPRLSPEALTARGVNVEYFNLV
jgi:hypothetical protein